MEDMRSLLRGSLAKSLSALSPLDRLSAAWPVACGRAMAGRGSLASFAEGRLTIEVADAAWLVQMSAMRAQLLGELRRIASVDLREIHFEVHGQARGETGIRASQPAKQPRKGSFKKHERT